MTRVDKESGCQSLSCPLADEDGRQDQHSRQVHTQGRLKEEGLEESGGKGDGNLEKISLNSPKTELKPN